MSSGSENDLEAQSVLLVMVEGGKVLPENYKSYSMRSISEVFTKKFNTDFII